MINAKRFYGSGSSEKNRPFRSLQPTRCGADVKCQPYKPSLEGDTRIWRGFRRQSEALAFVAEHADLKLKVFPVEADRFGQRSYLVCTSYHFWHFYQHDPPSMRHVYEMIRVGQPCRLYFDVEYCKATNTERVHDDPDGERCINAFVQLVFEQIEERFGLATTSEQRRRCVVDLESSSDEKFSRHLIFHLPGNFVFPDNQCVGEFCRHLADFIRHRQVDESEETFLVRNKNGDQQLLFDESVYSRYRNFRLYRASKAGKSHRFRLAPSCRFYEEQSSSSIDEQQVFFDSLIEVQDDKAQLLDVECLRKEVGRSGKPTATHSTSSSSSLIEKASKIVDYGRPIGSPYPKIDSFMEQWIRTHLASLHDRDDDDAERKTDTVDGDESSGYRTTTTTVASGEVRHIRKWTLLADESRRGDHGSSTGASSDTDGLLIYDVGRTYRYCHRVNRQHRSNHVYFVADLRRRVFYQKCYDDFCRTVNYKSNEWPLLLNVNERVDAGPTDSDSELCDYMNRYENVRPTMNRRNEQATDWRLRAQKEE